jgi:predicted transposase/invertase (TIGR01784 family)
LIKVNQFNERIKDKFDEWVYFLKTETIQPTFTAQGIRSAAKKLDILSLTEKERKAYERYEENTHYEASMHESHYGRGKLEGKAEGKNEIAINMLKDNEPLDKICRFTGLSQDEIMNLKNKL